MVEKQPVSLLDYPDNESLEQRKARFLQIINSSQAGKSLLGRYAGGSKPVTNYFYFNGLQAETLQSTLDAINVGGRIVRDGHISLNPDHSDADLVTALVKQLALSDAAYLDACDLEQSRRWTRAGTYPRGERPVPTREQRQATAQVEAYVILLQLSKQPGLSVFAKAVPEEVVRAFQQRDRQQADLRAHGIRPAPGI